VPVLIEPDTPPPTNPNDPVRVSELGADQWYVVESSVPIIVISSPIGIVDIELSAGPIRVRGKFADGNGQIETRTYSQPYLAFVTPAAKGVTEIIVYPGGATQESDLLRQMLTVMGPQPPPIVEPILPDIPVVDPVAPGKIQVVIIEDPSDRANIPAAQISIMDGQRVRQYVQSHGTDPADSNFRLLSLRQDVSQQPAWIKDAFSVDRPSLPYLVIVKGTQMIHGPLPPTMEDTMDLLTTHGGI